MSELANIAQQFSGLPMDSLIGGPLIAAAEANAKMAQSQADFIMRIGFNKTLVDSNYQVANIDVNKYLKDKYSAEYKEHKEVYDPIMVQLKLTKPSLDENGVQIYTDKDKTTPAPPLNFVIEIPLLSIVPISSLAVTNVDIHFEMEVKSSFDESTAETSKTKKEGSLEVSAGWGWGSIKIKGSASYSSEDSKSRDTHYQKSNNAKYVVDVKAGQLPLPTGITTILDVYAKNIFPKPIGNKKVEQEDGPK